MFDTLTAQIASEYDKYAPDCPQCGNLMEFVTIFGEFITWQCGKCFYELDEPRRTFHERARL
jgi:DNA-directed RNA polymerase subunit M/transcription elongation factor TFIIS